MTGRLVIGTRRYSSWSMRGWLAVAAAGLAVEEVVIPLAGRLDGGATPALAGVTETGLVPYLEHEGARIWESLAIVEYCAEHAPLWPEDRIARAHARAIAAEMHAGFAALRQAMPMNLGRADARRADAGRADAGRADAGGADAGGADAGRAGHVPAVLADIARIEALWGGALDRSGGPFLFGGGFGGADIMFAPVVARFLSYGPELSAASRAYGAAVRAHPLVVSWYEAAAQEPEAWRLAKYEAPMGGTTSSAESPRP